MASRLESLPPELLIRLVEYFSRPSDLRALCLTSKALQVPATTQLYHCVTGIDAVHGWTRSDLNTTVLAEANPGLAQICKLQFDTVAPAEQPDVGILAQVLKALPGSSLRGFDCSPCTVDEDTMITLMMRQHKLVTLGLGPLTFNPMPFVQAGLLDVSAFAKLEDLDIPQVIGSQHDLELYQLIIEKASLRRLSIRTTTIRSENPFNLDDEKDCDGLISKILFKHIRDAEPNTRMQLHALQLDDLDLKWSDRTFSRYFDWSVLKELAMWHCNDAGNLIKRLTQDFIQHGAQLKRFFYVSCTDEPVDSSVLEEFLGSVEGLTHLSLVGIENFSLLNLDVLDRHSGTLEWLMLHPDGFGNMGCIEMGIDSRFFSVVAKCQKLRQVALPLPKIDLPRTPDDFAFSQTYRKALTTLLDLPNLKSLRVYNLPLPKDKFIHCHVHDRDTNIINSRMYMQDLDDFVVSFLTPLFARSKAAVPGPILCFSGLGDCFVSDGDLEIEVNGPELYVLSRFLDPFGQTHLTMRNMPLSAVQYMEPESGILG